MLQADPRRKAITMVRLQDILQDESGATAVEYGLILAMVFLAIVAAITGVAGETINLWDNVETNAANATGLN